MSKGTHFDHWKVGFMDEEITKVHTCFAPVPYVSGIFSRKMAECGVNSPIPKEHGNFRRNKLQTMLLYEVNYKFNNKVLGRKDKWHLVVMGNKRGFSH